MGTIVPQHKDWRAANGTDLYIVRGRMVQYNLRASGRNYSRIYANRTSYYRLAGYGSRINQRPPGRHGIAGGIRKERAYERAAITGATPPRWPRHTRRGGRAVAAHRS